MKHFIQLVKEMRKNERVLKDKQAMKLDVVKNQLGFQVNAGELQRKGGRFL